MLKDNLKKARLKAGLTQKEVAERLGVAQQQYARWEQGHRNPKIEVLDKLAEIFGITTNALKGRDDGLEDIISTLRQYKLTDEDKAAIQQTIIDYMKSK
ncbi:helix-turn-helix transcriptional regulator [Streptococcus hyointestinalis]